MLPTKTVTANSLTGKKVRNSKGEDLGEIIEVMLDLGHARIAYLVMSFGGILGIGGKLFAVPVEALSLSGDYIAFELDVNKDVLEKAPGFDKDQWPKDADTEFLRQVYSHYGSKPYWQTE